MNPPPTSSALLPAPGDVVAAWPEQGQQLFLLLHGSGQTPADMLPLAHALAQQFAQGVIATLAVPAAMVQNPGVHPAAIAALQQVVCAWQAHAGLGPERTALFCHGTTANTALAAVMHDAHLCARLFALGGDLPALPPAMHQHTTLHWVHAQGNAAASAVQAAEALKALGADITLDVLPESFAPDSPALREWALFLLQNHVPLRLWREALASAQGGHADPAPPAMH